MRTTKKIHSEILRELLIVNAVLIFAALSAITAGAALVGYLLTK
ncbi:MAG: hypothetical protein AAB906_04820 [Patescibacteria group bacterium]